MSSRASRRGVFGLLGALALLARSAPAAEPRGQRPIAVLVGANAPPPGRQRLRYAESDARLLADTLVRTGRFARSDVHVLLEPTPAELLATLDDVVRDAAAERRADPLLVFYYSGHSDGQQLFPHGEALALSELRAHIERSSARVRVAILDACRGGAWTGTKGLTLGPPLEAIDLMNVETEGTALVSSSSGIENAHEAAVYGGSFFTHHLAAGLLGAADESGDGNVTLQEVFDYAKERTVRDSARMAVTTQHPSFEIELRGRQDVVLASLASGQSSLELTQQHPLEVVHVASGVTLLETLPGQGTVHLALPAGRYVVRRVNAGEVYSAEVEVEPGKTLRLDEAELGVSSGARLASKGGAALEPPPSSHDTLRASEWELRLGLGVSTGRPRSFGSTLYETAAPEARSEPLERKLDTAFSLTYGITDRLSWSVPLPAFTYRFGEEGELDLLLRGGLIALAYSRLEGALGTVDAGLALRSWLTPDVSLLSNATANWSFGSDDRDPWLELHASAGVVWNIANRVSVAFGAGWSGSLELTRNAPQALDADPTSELVFGAVQALGYRALPLVAVSLIPALSLDAYASWGFDLDEHELRDRYLAGVTWTF
jgi:caspase domain-containing protein